MKKDNFVNLNDSGLRQLIRKHARNATVSPNEADSDVDFYTDLAKAEGIRIGAEWQLQELESALVEVKLREKFLEEALEEAVKEMQKAYRFSLQHHDYRLAADEYFEKTITKMRKLLTTYARSK